MMKVKVFVNLVALLFVAVVLLAPSSAAASKSLRVKKFAVIDGRKPASLVKDGNYNTKDIDCVTIVSTRAGDQVENGFFSKVETFLGLKLRKIFDRDRIPFTISLVVSAYYAYLFYKNKDGGEWNGKFFQDGFCVQGLTDCGDKPCPCSGLNSHKMAFSADVVFTILAFVFHFKTPFGQPYGKWGSTISNAAVILGHGVLHWWISGASCKPPADLGSTFYTLFNLLLTSIFFIPDFGFSSIPRSRAIVYVILATVVLAIETPKFGNSAISFMFMTTHILTSLVGSLNPGDMVDPLLGWTFLLGPVLVSLIEFTNCDLLNKIGGHMWYDIALHISVLTSLINIKNDDKKKK